MFAQTEDVEADLVGQLDLFDQVAQPLVRADRAGAGLGTDVSKSVETEFHDLSSNGWVLRLEHVARKWSRF